MHAITGVFQRILPQVQNSDIEKCILMAASEDTYFGNILEWLLLKDSHKDIFLLEILMVTHILHFLPWRHVKEKRIFMDFFSGLRQTWKNLEKQAFVTTFRGLRRKSGEKCEKKWKIRENSGNFFFEYKSCNNINISYY